MTRRERLDCWLARADAVLAQYDAHRLLTLHVEAADEADAESVTGTSMVLSPSQCLQGTDIRTVTCRGG